MMTFLLGLKLCSVAIQVANSWLIAVEYRHPYGYRGWRMAWGMFFIASLFMIGRRVYDFFVSVSWISILLPMGVSVTMLLGLWHFAMIFRVIDAADRGAK